MQQDMIAIIDLGSEHNTLIARDIRALGVYTEIHNFDITADELAALSNLRGIILNGGPNRAEEGTSIEASDAVYKSGLPLFVVDHAGKAGQDLAAWPEDESTRHAALDDFVFNTCKSQANWNMENFIADQVELLRKQIGDKRVLLALSGGVDSSVVAALLIRAVGTQLSCVHVNHGLLRKGEAEQVCKVFGEEMN
ncbi:MAG: asparagine synthase-related protein, partial [Raoultibacter sp.]